MHLLHLELTPLLVEDRDPKVYISFLRKGSLEIVKKLSMKRC